MKKYTGIDDAAAENIIQLVREHREKENHEDCNISCYLVMKVVEGLLSRELTEEEKKLMF